MNKSQVIGAISIPTIIGLLLLLGGFYGSTQGFSDPILYAVFGFAFIFIVAGTVKHPKLMQKGRKVSTLWINASQKLFMVNSFLVLIYLLAPSLMEYTILGVSFSTLLVGISISTLVATVFMLIDRYMV